MTQLNDSIPASEALSLQEELQKLSSMPVEDMMNALIDDLVKFGLRVLAALAIYIVGAWIIKKLNKAIRRILEKKKVDPSLSTFLNSFISISLTILLIVITIGALGINTSSFAALLAAAGVAAGMALSGTLQNFAGGIMILFFKPFKVGDFIDAQSCSGTVQSIQITSTHILTSDNKKIIIPNGSLINGVIDNYSSTGTRRCEWKIGISYGDDMDMARKTILEILENDSRVLKTPEAPYVVLSSLDSSAVTISARAWVSSADYWNLYFSINELIYKELPKTGVSFPFPQMDITIKNS